jgi:hypothetical protein
MVCIVAPEHKEVFDGELVLLGPTNLETLLFVRRCGLERLLVEQVVYFFVIDLQETDADRDCAIFDLTCLRKHVSDGTRANACI